MEDDAFFPCAVAPFLDDDDLCALHFTSLLTRRMVASVRGRRWMTAASTAWFLQAFEYWNADIVVRQAGGLRLRLRGPVEPVEISGPARSSAVVWVPATSYGAAPQCSYSSAPQSSYSSALRRVAACRLRAAEKDNAGLIAALDGVPLGAFDNRLICIHKAVSHGSRRALRQMVGGWHLDAACRLELLHHALLAGNSGEAARVMLRYLPEACWADLGVALKIAVHRRMEGVAKELSRRMAAALHPEAFCRLVAEAWPEAGRSDMGGWAERCAAELGAISPTSAVAMGRSPYDALRAEMVLCAVRAGAEDTLSRFGEKQILALAYVDDRIASYVD